MNNYNVATNIKQWFKVNSWIYCLSTQCCQDIFNNNTQYLNWQHTTNNVAMKYSRKINNIQIDIKIAKWIVISLYNVASKYSTTINNIITDSRIFEWIVSYTMLSHDFWQQHVPTANGWKKPKSTQFYYIISNNNNNRQIVLLTLSNALVCMMDARLNYGWFLFCYIL